MTDEPDEHDWEPTSPWRTRPLDAEHGASAMVGHASSRPCLMAAAACTAA
jgi:hypothetical protein